MCSRRRIVRSRRHGNFSCGELGHVTARCPVVDASLPFLPPVWRADRTDDEFVLRPPPRGADCQQVGNVDLSGEGGWSPGSVMTMNPSSLLLVRISLVQRPGMWLLPEWGLSGLWRSPE